MKTKAPCWVERGDTRKAEIAHLRRNTLGIQGKDNTQLKSQRADSMSTMFILLPAIFRADALLPSSRISSMGICLLAKINTGRVTGIKNGVICAYICSHKANKAMLCLLVSVLSLLTKVLDLVHWSHDVFAFLCLIC